MLLVAGALAAAAALVAVDDSAGPLELLWAAILFECLAGLCLLVMAAARKETAERRAAERLSATGEREAAHRAVVEERALLAADIQAVVRSSTTRMAELAEEADRRWDDDPSAALAGIQHEGRCATDELRRMLGLLREAENAEDAMDPAPASTPGPAPGSWRARDLLLGAGAALLALVETLAANGSPDLPAGSSSPSGWVLTTLAAATLALRGIAPGSGAAACGLVYLLAAVVDRPVGGGLWVLGTVGGLAWAAAARRDRSGWPGLGGLAACLVVAQSWRDPGNLGIDLLILTVPALAGWFVGRHTARAAQAREEARRRAAELARAAEVAVRAERLAVARELHDVVSHGVGVMVMQAGAAEALRAVHGGSARAALEVVRQTAARSADELDRLVEVIREGAMGVPMRPSGGVDGADLQQLVRRMRAAGLTVQLSEDGRLDDSVAGAVYRVVQESLTNALRHAPGARVQVQVRTTGSAVAITVEDDGPGPRRAARHGFGLVGIAERVAHLGGELTAGPDECTGGFRVHARIPSVAGDSARAGA